MKRYIIILLMFVPLWASAQNRTIEALAKKYSDRDGFSTTVIKGDLGLSNGFAGSLNIENVDISNLIKDISSIIVVRAEEPDGEFAREVGRAVETGYSTILSSSTGGERVRFLLSENDKGSNNEFVIVITGKETNLVVSIVGDYTLGKVTRQE